MLLFFAGNIKLHFFCRFICQIFFYKPSLWVNKNLSFDIVMERKFLVIYRFYNSKIPSNLTKNIHPKSVIKMQLYSWMDWCIYLCVKILFHKYVYLFQPGLKHAAQNVSMCDNNVFEVIGGLWGFKLIKHNSKFIIRMSALSHKAVFSIRLFDRFFSSMLSLDEINIWILWHCQTKFRFLFNVNDGL